MAYGTRAAFEPIREVAFGAITANYTAVGTALTDHIRILSISNSTDVEVYISLDGVVDHLRLATNSFKLIDFSTNKIRDDGFFVPQGTVFFVRRVAGAPTSGSLWIEAAFATGGV